MIHLGEDKIKCLVCGELQKSSKGLGHHIKNRHGITSEEYYRKFFLKGTEDGFCKQCGKPTIFRSIRLGYQEFCGVKCSNINQEKNDKTRAVFKNRTDVEREAIAEKARKTRKERYGDEHYFLYGSDSFKENLLNKYGDENYSNREKASQTVMKHYGVKYLFCSREFIEESLRTKIERYGCGQNMEKLKSTNQSRYGVDYYVKAADFKDKSDKTLIETCGSVKESYAQRRELSKKTKLERYGDEDFNNSEKAKETMIKEKMLFCEENEVIPLYQVIDQFGYRWYNKLNLDIMYYKSWAYIRLEDIPKIEKFIEENPSSGLGYTSFPEKEVLNYVHSIYSGVVEENRRGIIKSDKDTNLELDIYIPDKNIAIEFDGSFWHSLNSGTSRDYHRYKTLACERLGIRLIHIFEDLWITKESICKSIISSSLGVYEKKIYARDCEVRDVDKCLEEKFLNDNHIQGYIRSSKCLGLFYNDELVQIISYGKARFSSNEVELYRMCSKIFVKVVGGFSKLLNHSGLKSLVTYVDRSMFDGRGYKSVGFVKSGEGSPGYFYIRGITRYNRMSFQKKMLKDKLKKFDENLSEIDNMMNNGYLVIFDSGNDKYEFRR